MNQADGMATDRWSGAASNTFVEVLPSGSIVATALFAASKSVEKQSRVRKQLVSVHFLKE